MYKHISRIIISCLLFCTACNDKDSSIKTDNGIYSIGDSITEEDWNMEFHFCYPSCPSAPENCEDLTTEEADTTFSFSKHDGKVFMIEMSATW